MRFKLDENLSAVLAQHLTEKDYDVATVADEGLLGCEDQKLYDACRAEHRILITLDMDFANPLRFPPESTAGIIVLRPARPLMSLIRSALLNALDRISSQFTEGSLWIVEPTNIRIYESPGKEWEGL